MDESLRVEAKAEEGPELEAAISRIIADIDGKRAQIQRDRADIDHLKSESRALHAETLALLNSLKAAA